MTSAPSSDPLADLGTYIRAQRKQAEMTLRDLAAKAGVSNPYISQIERGLHEPSMRVLRGISSALNLPLDTLLQRAGLIDAEPSDSSETGSVESAIAADDDLTTDQRDSLLAVYRSYIAANTR